MNRCKTSLPTALLAATLALLPCSLALLATSAQAQATAQNGVRQFPPAAQRGKLVITAAPEVSLNGKVDRLSPGARIRGTQNLLVMTGAIVGQELTVNYLRDSAGLIHEVWILNEAEAKEKRPGGAPPRNFTFASDPPKVDPNTPYDQLPKFKP